jgi:hypothetical protein
VLAKDLPLRQLQRGSISHDLAIEDGHELTFRKRIDLPPDDARLIRRLFRIDARGQCNDRLDVAGDGVADFKTGLFGQCGHGSTETLSGRTMVRQPTT